jgi:hypothetical protein
MINEVNKYLCMIVVFKVYKYQTKIIEIKDKIWMKSTCYVIINE